MEGEGDARGLLIVGPSGYFGLGDCLQVTLSASLIADIACSLAATPVIDWAPPTTNNHQQTNSLDLECIEPAATNIKLRPPVQNAWSCSFAWTATNPRQSKLEMPLFQGYGHAFTVQPLIRFSGRLRASRASSKGADVE